MNDSIEIFGVGVETAQWNDLRRADKSRDPLRRLSLALLNDALHLLEAGRENKSTRDARAWVRGDWSGGPFDFEHVCATLDYNADLLRSRILSGEMGKIPRSSPRGATANLRPVVRRYRGGRS